ncbi:MAG: hypothetical protein O7E52_03785 [Candidatus Poribacteria bacterium]|nr:hypothetical protein [Candidatus Poribacteria bacterium]
MKLWMDVMRDIEHVMDDYERLFDAWASGGVDGLVIGPMVFDAAKLLPGTVIAPTDRSPSPTFDPNPEVYRRLGVEPPAFPAHPSPEKRARLEQMFTSAKQRGWSVWIFQASSGAGPGGSGHIFADAKSRAATCARMIDTLEHYPMVDGAIMDGPEWGYEIAPHHMNHRSFIFHDLPESVAPKCAELGYDYAALVAAKDRLFECLHALRAPQLTLHASGGLLGAFQLFGGDPDLSAWLAFRVEALTDFFREVRGCLAAEMSRPVKLGVGPRSAAFSPLCGYDFAQLTEFMEVLLPKHYFFHRGFDRMVGTVYRYVETLTEWNPGLSDADALAVVKSLFGLELPGVQSRSDCEEALSPAFFEQVVVQETRRALAAVDDPDRVVPWLDTGRAPHDGDPMSAGDLKRLLRAAESVGLQRFLYHHHGNLTAGEWTVISEMCGETWRPLASDYHPPDQPVL